MPKAPGQKRDRRHLSFASKFAHFFIDRERFPIMDKYAAEMVGLHLGRKDAVRDAKHPYVAFCQNLIVLRSLARLNCSTRELDHYLWIAGEHRAWFRNSKAQINVELRHLSEALPSAARQDLKVISRAVENDV